MQAREPDHVEQLEDPGAPARPSAQTEGHVAADREVREQRSLLGDVPDAPMFARHEDAAAVDHLVAEHHFAVVEAFEPGDDAQQCGLAAPDIPRSP